MPEAPDDFQQLLEQARAGVPGATEQFHRRYAEHVLRVFRRKMAKRPILERVVGGSDCAQEFWERFFSRLILTKQFRTADQFLAYFQATSESIIREKEREYLHARKRNLRRDQALATVPASSRELMAGGRDRAGALAARDELLELVRQQPPRAQQALQMIADGRSVAEVAARFAVDERTMRRWLKELHAQEEIAKAPEKAEL